MVYNKCFVDNSGKRSVFFVSNYLITKLRGREGVCK